MNPLFDNSISYISDIFDNKLLFVWIVVFFSTFALIYIKRKAGSGFSIANRFLLFFFGKGNETEGELIDEIIEIEKFNFQYNTRAISKRQKKKFEMWVRKYELDFRIISKLKNNLDIERLKIIKINKKLPVLFFVIFFIPFFIAFETFILAVKPAGLININNTGWFWFNKDEAVEYNILSWKNKPWVITPKLCADEEKISIEFDKKTIHTICESFNSQKSLTYIEKLIKQQRYFFGTVTIVLLLAMYHIFKVLLSLLITFDARNMIYSKIKRYRKNRI